MRRNVGRPGDNIPLTSQKRGGRPASHVVTQVDVGVTVVIDADRDKALADGLYHRLIGVSGVLHHVTPVAPDRTYIQQNRLASPLTLVKCVVAPLQPFDT